MKKAMLRVVVGVLMLSTVIVISLNWSTISEADSNAVTPGSVDDPVVTKSYVDELLAQSGGGTGGGSTGSGEGTSSKLEVVTVPNGKILVASEGTEVIVRSGKAVAYSPDANGIADLTAGKDLTIGMTVPANHHMLFPRAGRGITTDPSYTKTLTVLVRGAYSFK